MAFPPPFDLTGSGVITLTKPNALIVQLVTLGQGVRMGRSNPPTTFDVGFLTPGDVNGWYPAIPIAQANQVIPMPPNITRLGYSMYRGSEVTVDEINIGYGSPESLWQRNVTLPGFGDTYTPVADGNYNQIWSYTVPANRVFVLSYARAGWDVETTYTGSDLADAFIGWTGAAFIGAKLASGYTPGTYMADWSGGLLYIPAGGGLAGYTYVPTGATGTIHARLVASGMEFDA